MKGNKKILNKLNKIFISNFKSISNLYFKSPQPFEFSVKPHHNVPDNIIRPNYILDKNFNYENKQISIHNNEQDVINHKLSCKITSKVLQHIEDLSESNAFNSTEDIDVAVHNKIIELGAYPTAIGFMGFPKSVCTSVNEIVVHGIPNTRKLEDGDSINVDVTSFKYGFHGDSSIMIYKNKNKVHDEILKLGKITREAMYKAIKICKPGEKIANIGKVIEEYASKYGYFVVKEFSGHGVGKNVHMNHSIIHFDISKYVKNSEYENLIMKPGMAFTIEPVLCMKSYTENELGILEDNWTVILPVDNPSAQWEHIILITNDGHDILTFRDKEVIPDIF